MLESLLARPDIWSAHYNVGNFYLEQNMPKKALLSYRTALKLEPRAVMPMINASMACIRIGDSKGACDLLEKAYELEPSNAAANFNLGLLKAELGSKKEAEKYLRSALKIDPTLL